MPAVSLRNPSKGLADGEGTHILVIGDRMGALAMERTVMRFDLALALIGLAVAIVGLGFAIWQFFDMRRATRELVRVKESMSTQYIGEFPAFMSKIIELIEDANSSVSVVCDVPAYGYF